MLLLLVLGCVRESIFIGTFGVAVDRKEGTFEITRGSETLMESGRIRIGTGAAEVDFLLGSYLFSNETTQFTTVDSFKLESMRDEELVFATLRDAEGGHLGVLQIYPLAHDLLGIQVLADSYDHNRVELSFDCTDDEVFWGGGGHAWDVDHAGEAFGLWVSEPGIGKVDGEDPPEDWYVTGTRHSSSYPVPAFVRPQLPMGVALDSWARVDVDLCASDPTRWSLTNWEADATLLAIGGDTSLDVLERHTLAAGTPAVPPDWAFAPWNDAIRGEDRVREVAETLRSSGATSSVIWTEDWKGADETLMGYQLTFDWSIDEGLYPAAETLSADLEDLGFKWFAYFSPFVSRDSAESLETTGHLIQDENGEDYWFEGVTLTDTSVLDLTDDDAIAWAQDQMLAALDLGFDGWMADFAEWLPADARLDGMDALDDHNLYPRLWQAVNAEVMEDYDATFFTRSGWAGSHAVSPVTWAGDQRTNYASDDGFPTVVSMGLGLSMSGVAFYAHDIAGYQSMGNEPSDKELWFRWCSLGAFSPIMRTHHGLYDEDNWQFDSDEETLAHFAQMSQEHARLYPYLRGLADQAAQTGRPLLLHPALLFEDTDPTAIDSWMLGQSLWVAPVLEAGATGREVALPTDVTWYDWWTGAEATAGWKEAAMDEIPVFAAAGTIVPTLTWAPDTFVDTSSGDLTTLSDADSERTIYVYGDGGSFTENDGTTYAVESAPTTQSQATDTLSTGTVEVGGASVNITGAVERTYTVVVHP